jgi:tetratricopeptide (TPR) repeat protein
MTHLLNLKPLTRSTRQLLLRVYASTFFPTVHVRLTTAIFLATIGTLGAQADLPTGYINHPSSEKDVETNKEVERKHINIAPLYGGRVKSKDLQQADQKFIETILTECKCSRPEAAKQRAAMGWKFLRKGDAEMASKRFNQAYLLDSTNASLYWGFAAIMGRQNRYDESLDFFRRAYRFKTNKKDTAQAFLCRDFALTLRRKFEETGQPRYADEGLRLLAEAAEIYISFPGVHMETSKMNFALRKFDRALASYNVAVSLDSNITNRQYLKQVKDSLQAKR